MVEVEWRKFEYNGQLDEGIYWFVLESPDFDTDVDDYGNPIGIPTGKTHRRVVMCELVWDGEEDNNGSINYFPNLTTVDWSEDKPMHDEEVITRYAIVEKPACPV